MEKKTIGAFIAALRKASGLTQRQLAEKLNVSDKAVSRWERDECAPDLSLIPVIAEIFGVTSDEILRGQRRDPDASPTPYEEQKTEKQVQNILKKAVTQFRMESAVSIAISVIGLIAAIICNFGFLRAYIGFGVACVFYVCGTLVQTISTIKALSALNVGRYEQAATARTTILRLTMAFFSVIIVLFCATAPLLLAGDAYYGLTGSSWLQYGAIYTTVSTIVCGITVSAIMVALRNRGLIHQSDCQHEIRKLRLRHVRRFLVCFAVTFVIYCCVHLFLQPKWFASPHEFDNWDDFKTYMETPTYYADDGDYTDTELIPIPNYQISTDDYPYTETVVRPNGTVLCEYTIRNHTVGLISYGDQVNDYLPVRVYTSQALQTGQHVVNSIGYLILLLILPEAIICYIHYRKEKNDLA